MTVKYFDSNMTGAPVMSGTAGSLINVLDACLITGFNLKTLDSLNVTGAVAAGTVAAGHGFAVDRFILISGATPAGLNGERKVIGITSTQFTFAAPGISDGAASGMVTAKCAPVANWIKAFNGTNKSAYKSTDTAASGLFLRVDDTTTTYAAVRGYESMTDVDTGAGLFPATAQLAGPCIVKSSTADATARPWVLIADEKRFYFFARWHASYARYGANFFGDIASFKVGDAYRAALVCDTQSGGGHPSQYNNFSTVSPGLSSVQVGHYLARDYNQVGGAVPFGKLGEYVVSTAMGASGMAYPSPVDNGLYVSGVAVNHGGILRGIMPGLYQPLHANPLAHGATVSDVAGLAGKTLLAITIDIAGSPAQCMIDITGWE